MDINLAEFQIKTIKELKQAMESSYSEIVLKAPTGSGKTIIMTTFMSEFLAENDKTVFIWLTPGKGSLEEQSKEKMDRYIHNSSTKLLSDVMSSGFYDGDSCFINWEKLTKKGNTALRDTERTNFISKVENAHYDGLKFIVIIDESHQNFTAKADEIIQLFNTNKIIRCSATPIINKDAKLIEITDEEVIQAGLIKKLLVINENFPQFVETDNNSFYLLDAGLKKQIEIIEDFNIKKIKINPLIIVQLPNDSGSLLEEIIEYLESKGITIETGELAVWLSDRHENLENISINNSYQKVVIIKQAIATGWDCPRAHILVKLRNNMDETFEIQTIGRIRRMPEAKHYNDELLDSCYLYTFDTKFTEGVKQSLGKDALDAKTIFLKKEYKSFSLVKEQRSMIDDSRDPRKALKSIFVYMENKYSLSSSISNNKTILESNGFIFENSIIKYTYSGKVVRLSELSDTQRMNAIRITEPINTHGRTAREYHNRVANLGYVISMEYQFAVMIIGKLFGEKFNSTYKILKLTPKELYAFVINNYDLLNEVFRDSTAVQIEQLKMKFETNVVEKEFKIPQKILFTYNSKNRVQNVYSKNVYNGYLSSAEPRYSPEKRFEKFCENCDNVKWFYKNGDKGDEYLSIVYQDNTGKNKLFYPDYIVNVNGKIWIIETKGGFDRKGNSEDIDIFSPKKFEVLKRFLTKHSLNGGFVRFDKNSEELFICINDYNDDINSTNWKLLSELFQNY